MTPPADRPREIERLRAIHTPHVHTWRPIDETIFAQSYAQPDVEVCLEDGVTREVSDAD